MDFCGVVSVLIRRYLDDVRCLVSPSRSSSSFSVMLSWIIAVFHMSTHRTVLMPFRFYNRILFCQCDRTDGKHKSHWTENVFFYLIFVCLELSFFFYKDEKQNLFLPYHACVAHGFAFRITWSQGAECVVGEGNCRLLTIFNGGAEINSKNTRTHPHDVARELSITVCAVWMLPCIHCTHTQTH